MVRSGDYYLFETDSEEEEEEEEKKDDDSPKKSAFQVKLKPSFRIRLSQLLNELDFSLLTKSVADVLDVFSTNPLSLCCPSSGLLESLSLLFWLCPSLSLSCLNLFCST